MEGRWRGDGGETEGRWRGDGGAAGEMRTWLSVGNRKAPVFPLPVCAQAIRSLWAMPIGTEWRCTCHIRKRAGVVAPRSCVWAFTRSYTLGDINLGDDARAWGARISAPRCCAAAPGGARGRRRSPRVRGSLRPRLRPGRFREGSGKVQGRSPRVRGSLRPRLRPVISN